MFENLNEDNYLLYAIKCYDTPHCIMSEFESDLKRIKYIKRLFRRFKITDELKERLIINHLILMNNVFGVDATTRLLFLKIDENDYDILKTFLLYLDMLPVEIIGINGDNIVTDYIPINQRVVEVLSEI